MKQSYGFSDELGGIVKLFVDGDNGSVEVKADVKLDEEKLAKLIDALNEARYYAFHYSTTTPVTYHQEALDLSTDGNCRQAP